MKQAHSNLSRVCQFSPCRRWRYTLWREWDMTNPTFLMVIGLNPSTADETQDDPTVRLCIGYAKRWGFGALCMTNIFAWRETSPDIMKAQPSPVGVDNDAWLKFWASRAGLILGAWGIDGAHLGRGAEVARLLNGHGLHCLGTTKSGHPWHPLYKSKNLRPQKFALPQ